MIVQHFHFLIVPDKNTNSKDLYIDLANTINSHYSH